MATVTYIDHWANPARKIADINLTVGDTTIKAGGKFREQGVDYDLEEEEFHITERPFITYLTGHLVVEKESGDLRLFVDEEVADGVDAAYRFGETGLYEPLFILFQAVLPPDTGSLKNIEVQVHRVLDRVARDAERIAAMKGSR